MGLRLNGVDYVDIKDLKIENIHSSTGIGTLLGGPYETVVSQQAPYMNGFSMNMVNGLTMTFSTNVILSNVEVSHIISNTGLSYGVAVWYETHVNIFGKKGLKIHHVHAGQELAPSDEFRRDSYPNLKPEACAFRIYDDVIYNAVVKYDDNANNEENVEISCNSGHTGCLMDNDDYSNIGYVESCEEDGDMINMNHIAISKKYIDANTFGLGNVTDKKGMYIMFGSVLLLLMAIIYYYRFSSKTMTKLLLNSHEDTPLLNQPQTPYN